MTDKKQVAEPEIAEDGIICRLGGDYWIKFSKSWGSLDTQRFSKVPNDLLALKLLINKTVDWHLPDENWNDLPFEKDKLLQQIDDFVNDPTKECFAIPTSLQIQLAKAYYQAAGASYKVDFLALVQSRVPPTIS